MKAYALPALIALTACGALVAGCSRDSQPSTTTGQAAAPKVRFGEAMGEVGRRFELAGRAALANRFELASFEISEVGEIFAELPNAELPKEGNAAVLPPMIEDFTKANLPALAKAAKSQDRNAFDQAFARAAASCNACHEASGHAFVEIPNVPGKAVPDVDPRTPDK